jgi:hypothetical protein
MGIEDIRNKNNELVAKLTEIAKLSRDREGQILCHVLTKDAPKDTAFDLGARIEDLANIFSAYSYSENVDDRYIKHARSAAKNMERILQDDVQLEHMQFGPLPEAPKQLRELLPSIFEQLRLLEREPLKSKPAYITALINKDGQEPDPDALVSARSHELLEQLVKIANLSYNSQDDYYLCHLYVKGQQSATKSGAIGSHIGEIANTLCYQNGTEGSLAAAREMNEILEDPHLKLHDMNSGKLYPDAPDQLRAILPDLFSQLRLLQEREKATGKKASL